MKSQTQKLLECFPIGSYVAWAVVIERRTVREGHNLAIRYRGRPARNDERNRGVVVGARWKHEGMILDLGEDGRDFDSVGKGKLVLLVRTGFTNKETEVEPDSCEPMFRFEFPHAYKKDTSERDKRAYARSKNAYPRDSKGRFVP